MHLKTVNFVPVTEVFHDMQEDVDYDPFVDSDMTWGDANHTLYPVSRLQDALEEMPDWCSNYPTYQKMVDRLKGFSPDTLVDMEN